MMNTPMQEAQRKLRIREHILFLIEFAINYDWIQVHLATRMDLKSGILKVPEAQFFWDMGSEACKAWHTARHYDELRPHPRPDMAAKYDMEFYFYVLWAKIESKPEKWKIHINNLAVAQSKYHQYKENGNGN